MRRSIFVLMSLGIFLIFLSRYSYPQYGPGDFQLFRLPSSTSPTSGVTIRDGNRVRREGNRFIFGNPPSSSDHTGYSSSEILEMIRTAIKEGKPVLRVSPLSNEGVTQITIGGFMFNGQPVIAIQSSSGMRVTIQRGDNVTTGAYPPGTIIAGSNGFFRFFQNETIDNLVNRGVLQPLVTQPPQTPPITTESIPSSATNPKVTAAFVNQLNQEIKTIDRLLQENQDNKETQKTLLKRRQELYNLKKILEEILIIEN